MEGVDHVLSDMLGCDMEMARWHGDGSARSSSNKMDKVAIYPGKKK